ncbi:hypothetical protein Strain138_002413 [Pseudogemmatithrix spongiicola]|uniref:Uncharacterized protein n=1 Tax=Pseudogemmatithrix spongiicola TaxID=3062599 RepID=A0AA49JWW8_9BACT|nr:hypothetical protein Strain138_002413 [Gemmatimonadaceae bacterium 'strain 138']
MIESRPLARWSRAVITSAIALLVVSLACAERVTGPGNVRIMEGVRPVFLLDGAPAPLPVGSVRVLITTIVGARLADTVLTFPGDGSDITLSVPVQVGEGTSEVRTVAEFRDGAGNTLFRSEPVAVRILFANQGDGPPPSPVSVPLTYVGPGSGRTLQIEVDQAPAVGFAGDTLGLSATVRDQTSAVVAGVPLVWASLDTTVAQVSSALDGRFVLGPQRGTARLVGSTYTGARDTVTIAVQPLPAQLQVVGSATLTDTVATTGASFRVRVLGGDGLPLRDAEVRFTAVGVTLDSTSARSDAQGEASVRFRLPNLVGTYGVTAAPARGSGSAALTVIAVPDSAVAARVTGVTPPSVRAGDSLPQLSVGAVDRFGNAVPTFADTVRATLVDTAGQPLGSAVARVPAGGVASFVGLRPLTAAPRALVELRAGALPPVRSDTFAVLAASPVALRAIGATPDSSVAGTLLPTLEVEAVDAFGNRAPQFADSVRIAPIGAGPLLGRRARVATAGVARFDSLALTKAESGVRLALTAAALAPDTTAAIRVKPAAPARVVVVSDPLTSVVAGDTTLRVGVGVEDAYNNFVPTATNAVTVSLLGGTAALFGDTARAASAGIASFTGLSVRVAAAGYRLRVAADGLTPDTSAAFAVTPAAAARLAVTAAPTDSTAAGATLAPFSLTAYDAYDNVARGFADTVTASLNVSPLVATLGGTTKVKADTGKVTFTGLSIAAAGTAFRLIGSAPGLVPDTSDAFRVYATAAVATVFVTEPQASIVAGDTIVSVTVETRDALGNRASTGAPIALTLIGGDAGATLLGTTSLSGDSARATFSGLRLTRAGSAYRLVASSGVTTADTSQVFAVTAAAATTLAWVTQPASGAVAGDTLGSFSVAVHDAYGNVVPISTDVIVLSLSSNPSGASLHGFIGNVASAGIATFGGGTIVGRPGTGFVLQASLAGLTSAQSLPFDVVPPTPTPRRTILSVGNAVCGIAASDAPYCWGRGYLSAGTASTLGNGTTPEFQGLPLPVSGGLSLKEISTSTATSCGLTTGGAAYCWGATTNGQLGDGGVSDGSVPAPVQGGLVFRTISVGTGTGFTQRGFACGVTLQDDGYCWGSNENGQLGNGTTTIATVPTLVSGGLKFATIRADRGFACGLTLQGAAYCWGTGAEGQLGNGSVNPSLTPTAVVGGLSFIDLDLGDGTACGLSARGDVWCWGQYPRGIASGLPASSSTPVSAAFGYRFVEISANINASCGRKADATVWCWGNGALSGGGSNVAATTPQLVAGGHSFAALARVANATRCAVDVSGAVHCWGFSVDGRLADGVNGLTPSLVSGAINFASISGGRNHHCGLTGGGTAYCWGLNGSGQVGNGTVSPGQGSFNAPTTVVGGVTFARLERSTGQVTCGITADSTGYCWGLTHWGDTTGTPTIIPGGHKWIAIAASLSHACGIVADSTAYCWGQNTTGVLGDSSTVARATPGPVYGGHRFTRISTNQSQSCGVVANGDIYCWGAGAGGQLGYGGTTSQTIPTRVASTGITFVDVSTVIGASCGLASTGQAYCWGNGTLVGYGSTTNALTPTPVASGLSFSKLRSGANQTCGLATSGAAYCWGENYYAELGNGNTTRQLTPAPVAGGQVFVDITTGFGIGCGLTAGGQTYCWGRDVFGQRGRAQPAVVYSPTAAQGGITFRTTAP